MKYIIALTFVLLCQCAEFDHKVYANDESILIVNERTDEVQRVPWKEGVNFYDVLAVRSEQNPSIRRAYIISNGKIQIISRFNVKILNKVAVRKGDIIIFGGLSHERLEKLRVNREIDVGFKSLPNGALPPSVMP